MLCLIRKITTKSRSQSRDLISSACDCLPSDTKTYVEQVRCTRLQIISNKKNWGVVARQTRVRLLLRTDTHRKVTTSRFNWIFFDF